MLKYCTKARTLSKLQCIYFRKIYIMEKHYLTPLFSPKSIVVFAGVPLHLETENVAEQTGKSEEALLGLNNPDHPDDSAVDSTAFATLPVRNISHQISSQIRNSGFAGPITFLDVSMSGRLADLAQSRADLAVIALPDEELVEALEVAGRIQCRSALIISSGVGAALARELHAIAQRHGIYLLGPNCLGYQCPRLKINASLAGSLAQNGSLALISQSGALTSSILDWAGKMPWGFQPWFHWGQILQSIWRKPSIFWLLILRHKVS